MLHFLNFSFGDWRFVFCRIRRLDRPYTVCGIQAAVEDLKLELQKTGLSVTFIMLTVTADN